MLNTFIVIFTYCKKSIYRLYNSEINMYIPNIVYAYYNEYNNI